MKNHKGLYLNLHTVNDKNIIEKLEKVYNKQGYIKALINADALFYHSFKRKGEKNG